MGRFGRMKGASTTKNAVKEMTIDETGSATALSSDMKKESYAKASDLNPNVDYAAHAQKRLNTSYMN